jgi:excisionase family DNA binding protein
MSHAGAPAVAILATPEEAAKALRLGRSKVYELIETGELKSIKIGRSRRIRWNDLTAYVDGLAA